MESSIERLLLKGLIAEDPNLDAERIDYLTQALLEIIQGEGDNGHLAAAMLSCTVMEQCKAQEGGK